MTSAGPAELVEEFDPHDPAITADDLYQRYGRLRTACPVTHHSPHGAYWLATGYDVVRAAALDAATFRPPTASTFPPWPSIDCRCWRWTIPSTQSGGEPWRRVQRCRRAPVAAADPRDRRRTDRRLRYPRPKPTSFTTSPSRSPLTLIGEIFGLEPEQRAQVREDALKFLNNSTGDAREGLCWTPWSTGGQHSFDSAGTNPPTI